MIETSVRECTVAGGAGLRPAGATQCAGPCADKKKGAHGGNMVSPVTG